MTRFSTPFTSCCATTTPILRLPVCVVVTNIVFALALLAAGCSSSGSDDTTAETVISTTTSTETPATTQATTVETSDPEPSVTTASPAEWTPEELEIIDAYDDFLNELVAVLIDPNREVDQLRGHSSAAIADPLVSRVLADRVEGLENRGSVEFTPAGVRFDSETVVELETCYWGQVEELTDGKVTIAADEFPSTQSVRMVFESGSWRYDGQSDPGAVGEACEL